MEYAKETFLQADCLDSLWSDFSSLEEMQKCWHDLCWQEIESNSEKLLSEKPAAIDCRTVETDGHIFRVYGVVHGWTGGPSAEYRQLVENSLESEENVLFEKMLGQFYGEKEDVEIPDFWVLGRLGQIVLGLRSMLMFPLFMYYAIKDMAREIFTRKEKPVKDIHDIIDSVCYHNVDPELRRGMDGSLPTALQIELELSHWRDWNRYANVDYLMAIAARSGYIAEFAKNFARDRELGELAIVVGDRHLTEVEYFLRTPLPLPEVAAAAALHAERISNWRYYYHYLFARYMGMMSVGVTLGFIPYLLLAALASFYLI